VGHHAVQEMVESLGHLKFCSRWFPRLLAGTEEHKTAGNSNPPYSPGLAPLRLPLVRALESSPERSPLRDWRGSPGTVRSWLRGAGTDTYRRSIFKVIQRWQKCTYRDGDFVGK
jgi:hypothetical protein